METPIEYSAYRCADYFLTDRFTRGFWDERSQLWLVLPVNEVFERPDLNFLVIGRPDADGIEFGYRKGEDSIWAYYPIEGRFTRVAQNLDALLQGWVSGALKV